MKTAWRVILAGVLTTVAMTALFALRPLVLEQLEWELLDWRFRLRGEQVPESPVAIVGIDAKSIEALGRWPWPRDVLARLIESIDAAGALAIGVDVTFSEPEELRSGAILARAGVALEAGSDPDRGLAAEIRATIQAGDTDSALEAALAGSDRVALGYFFRTDATSEGLSAEALDDAQRPIRRTRIGVTRLPDEGMVPVLRCTGIETSLPRFHEKAATSGFLNAQFDLDGVLRQAPLVLRCGDALYPSLALALVETAVGRRAMVVGDAFGIQNVVLAGSAFPTDEGGRVLINFRGPAFTFPHYSAVDVLDGSLPPETLAGRIVLIGATEVGIGDIRNTPFGRVFPGVEVHANIIDNLLTGEVLKKDADLELVEAGMVLGLGLLVSFAVPLLGSALRGALFTAAVGGLLLAGVVYAFERYGLWLNLTYPGLAVLVTYLVVAVAQSVLVERSRRQIRRAFSTYVPPGVVDEMTRRPESFQLGGETRVLSILFSDLRGFTTLSQNLGARETATLLNVYLTEMTQVVFDTGGTLDKYIGDAVMAFWGAPLPVADHGVAAAEAAVGMQERVAWLKQNRSEIAGVPQLRVGIGLHSAEVVVGNLGSDLRFDYTLAGDGVNLCSRLEGLTKYYRVGILTSEELAASLPADFRLRPLDTIQVVGKDQATRILEIRGRGGDEDADADWLEAYAQAEGSFRAGDWTAAEGAANEAQRLHSALGASDAPDGPTEFLLERIRAHAGCAPDDWQGTWVFDEK